MFQSFHLVVVDQQHGEYYIAFELFVGVCASACGWAVWGVNWKRPVNALHSKESLAQSFQRENEFISFQQNAHGNVHEFLFACR